MQTKKTKDLAVTPPWLVRVSLGSDRAGDEAFRGRREHPATAYEYFT